jgi:hypothetical protein
MKHKNGHLLVAGLAIGAWIIIFASASTSASADTGGSGFIRFEKVDPLSGELPMADEASEEAMSTQNPGFGTVFIPSKEDTDKEGSDK